MNLRQVCLFPFLVSVCACAGDPAGTWQGETQSGQEVDFVVDDDGSVTGEIVVNPDNVYGCDGTGADRMTFEVDGSIIGTDLSADLYNSDHPSDAEMWGTVRGGSAGGEVGGTTELYGTRTCDAIFLETWEATRL